MQEETTGERAEAERASEQSKDLGFHLLMRGGEGKNKSCHWKAKKKGKETCGGKPKTEGHSEG